MKKESLVNDTTILGLDVSFHRTGWAITKGFELLGYGNMVPPKEFKKVTFKCREFADVLYWYSAEISALCKSSEPDYVVMEDLNVRFVNTAKVMMQIQAAAKIGVVKQGHPVYMINNKTVKSFWDIATGKNQITAEVNKKAKIAKQKPVKIQMVDKINEMFGISLTYEENDEADAIGLCLTLLKEIGGSL